MDYETITFWLIFFSCLSPLVFGMTRVRNSGRGWIVVYSAILAVLMAGRLIHRSALTYVAAALWLLLVLLPGLIGRQYQRRFFEQRYSKARRLARLISWLHPADGWRELPSIVYALELAERGELVKAAEKLRRFQSVSSVIGLAAITNLYRITQQWEELLIWYAAHRHEVDRHPQLLPTLLRGLGETGDVRGLVELYDQRRHEIARLVPTVSRDVCRLELFAFTGRRQDVERLFAGGLSLFPPPIRTFWLATADVAAGESESARRQLEVLLPSADPVLRASIERRLSHLSILPGPMDDFAKRVVAEAARDQSHDESFGIQRPLLSKGARATQLIILLNVAMFAAEMIMGGSSNEETLYRLGALEPSAVRGGEVWRLVASLFLHFGPLHLAMNMLGLWMLGPFVEFALGFRRFIVAYLVAGIGSMCVVLMLGRSNQMTVGASGAILGLVGATAALMLRAWLREKAVAAKQRLIAVLTIVAMQTMFDFFVPEVSTIGHLSGTVIGFAVTLLLRDRLIATARQLPVAASQPVKTSTAG